jgi:hypothetical protein
MSSLSYAVLVAAWALMLGGCLAAPRSEDWLAVGFRTPEQTFRTFQTGLRAGLPDLEYRCLSSGFKQRAGGEGQVGFSQAVYREFRSELFRRQPLLKLAARACIRETQPRGADRVRVLAEVDTWPFDEVFAVDFVREDYYELWVGGKRVADDTVDWGRIARTDQGELEVRVPLPPDLRGSEVGELRAGHEWKIDGFPLQDQAPRSEEFAP